MNTIAIRLRHAREVVRHLTQDQLAVLADVSQSTVGNIESGTRQGKASLIKIAKALRVSQDWLIDGVGDIEPTGLLPVSKPQTTTVAQALEALDAALAPLDTQARRIAVGMLSGLESPGNNEMVAAMLSAAIESSKRRAA